MVHSESRYRTRRNNTGFSFLHLIPDLGTLLWVPEEHAVRACLVEVQADDMENKFIHGGVVPSVAVQAACRLSARGLTYLSDPAHGSGAACPAMKKASCPSADSPEGQTPSHYKKTPRWLQSSTCERCCSVPCQTAHNYLISPKPLLRNTCVDTMSFLCVVETLIRKCHV